MASNPNPKTVESIPKGIPRSTITSNFGKITRLGIGGTGVGDLYHMMLTTTWPRFLGWIVFFYSLINIAFAVVYTFLGGIEFARPRNFEDAFFFSVQTLGTIGYGKMSPITTLSNLVVTVESLTGMIGVALITGLIFAKVARPTARVMWSNVLVIARREGVPTLMFRLANERTNSIVEAGFRVTVLMDELTKEGERLRRLHDLGLARASTPALSLTFTVMHPIVPGSLLHGKTPEDLARMNAQFICSVAGMDDTMNAAVHARKSYTHSDVRWHSRFVDILSPLRDGSRLIDYTRFHETEPDRGE